jgi:hypothetical protein
MVNKHLKEDCFMNINKKELFEKVESLVDQLVQLVSECDLTEVKEYVEYYDLVAKMIVASGQTPIEKITHASTLISILHLRNKIISDIYYFNGQ